MATIVMPAARRELAEHGLKPVDVKPTGPGGRLLKEDVQRHAAQPAATAVQATPVVAATPAAPVARPPARAKRQDHFRGRARRRSRPHESATAAHRRATGRGSASRRLADDLQRSRHERRDGPAQEHREAFQQSYGVKLGFMSFFVKATIEALKAIPQINAEIPAAISSIITTTISALPSAAAKGWSCRCCGTPSG